MLQNVLLVNYTFEAFSSLGVWIHLVNPPIALHSLAHGLEEQCPAKYISANYPDFYENECVQIHFKKYLTHNLCQFMIFKE